SFMTVTSEMFYLHRNWTYEASVDKLRLPAVIFFGSNEASEHLKNISHYQMIEHVYGGDYSHLPLWINTGYTIFLHVWKHHLQRTQPYQNKKI
ncbi:hypothetical protein ACJX0J_034233, partial [Zea mays]